MAERSIRDVESDPGSPIFGSDDEPGEVGTRNRRNTPESERGIGGTIKSLRNALGSNETGGRQSARRSTETGSEPGRSETNEPAPKRKYTRRTNNETVATWSELITAGLDAWTSVLQESRGPHWQIPPAKLERVGQAYGRIIAHYMPAGVGGESALWTGALIATGSTFAKPIAIDFRAALAQAKAAQSQRAARRPQPPFWGTPSAPPFAQPPPPPGWNPYDAPPVQPQPPFPTPPQPAPHWEVPAEPDITQPAVVDENGVPIPPESIQADDLRGIGQAMGLDDASIDWAMKVVQNLMGNADDGSEPNG